MPDRKQKLTQSISELDQTIEGQVGAHLEIERAKRMAIQIAVTGIFQKPDAYLDLPLIGRQHVADLAMLGLSVATRTLLERELAGLEEGGQ